MGQTRASAKSEAVERAVEVFRKQGGMLRMATALRAGIHRNTLYAMLEAGIIERLARGLYCLAEAQPWVPVARRFPKPRRGATNRNPTHAAQHSPTSAKPIPAAAFPGHRTT